jgi:anti-sigma B factor antagonist
LDVAEVGDVTVVRFRDQRIIEDLQIQEIRQELLGLADEGSVFKILLDFSCVTFGSAAFLGILITLDKKLKAKGGVLKLCSVRPEVYEVFATTRMDRLLDIRRDESDGLDSF